MEIYENFSNQWLYNQVKEVKVIEKWSSCGTSIW